MRTEITKCHGTGCRERLTCYRYQLHTKTSYDNYSEFWRREPCGAKWETREEK